MIVRGRGITYLDGEVPCPLAGVGTRGGHASNRLVLDDEHTEVHVEPGGRRLVVENRRRYPQQTLIGDFMILGRGETGRGPVPFAVHTRFDKRGTTVRARPHLHPAVPASLQSLVFEPFEVVIKNDAREQTVLTPELVRKVGTSPPLSDWVGRALLQVRREPAPPRSACLLVSVGLGPLRRDMVRAEVRALAGAPAEATLAELLLGGAWELGLTALSNLRSAREHIARAMFVLGLDGLPVLARVAEGGIAKGETLAFRLEGGRGTVRLGADEAELPAPLDVARAFLEMDFLGAMLAHALTGPYADERRAIVL